MSVPSKTCVSCGRTIHWRKKWERDWEDVRYCSAGCRRRGVTSADADLEDRILAMIGAGSRSSTILDTDVARDVAPDDWRPMTEPVRRAARRLVDRGVVEIVQHGAVVDPSRATGPIGIRLAR